MGPRSPNLRIALAGVSSYHVIFRVEPIRIATHYRIVHKRGPIENGAPLRV